MWYDLKKFNVEGRGWDNPNDYYSRLPAKAEATVPEPVWRLSSSTSGMVARFVTDSDSISVKWKLRLEKLEMRHMPASGVSGVDLYVRHKGQWRWLAIGIPSAIENESVLRDELPREKREYALYLPLYNGVEYVEIGISDDATIEAAPPRTRNIKPVVFYGSSITQGACASRPGMVYTSIIGRHLDIPTMNLGFNGSGRCEHEVSDILAELDPEIYILDCMPNPEVEFLDERLRYLIKLLKEKHPNTPVVLVGLYLAPGKFLSKNPRYDEKNRILEKVFGDYKDEWNGNLYYVKGSDLYGNDGEATVDGCHASDVGFMRMAEVIEPVIAKILDDLRV